MDSSYGQIVCGGLTAVAAETATTDTEDEHRKDAKCCEDGQSCPLDRCGAVSGLGQFLFST